MFAYASAFFLGIAKGGIKGIDAIIVTLLALAFEAKASTGIMVPLLITGDIMAVIYYRRDVQIPILFKLLPYVLTGVVIGALLGKDLPETFFRRGMAIIILISVVIMYLYERRKSLDVPHQRWFAGIMGTSAGMATMIGNLAGAFANIFFLAIRLPKNQFIGTIAWLFFIVNLFKLPFHIFYWETITAQSLKIDLYLVGGTVIGFLAGVRLVSIINNEVFRKMILVLTAIGAVIIFLR